MKWSRLTIAVAALSLICGEPRAADPCLGNNTCLDIADYDACQGGSDDSSFIQDAIDDLTAAQPILLFTCLAPVQSTLLVDSPGFAVTIRGDDLGDGILLSASVDPALQLIDCDGCRVEDMTFDSFESPATYFHGVQLRVRTSDGPQIVGNTFLNANRDGSAALYATGNTDAVYSGNTVDTTLGLTRGMWIGNGGSSADPEIRPLIEGNNVTDTAHSAIATHTTGGVIRNNTVEYAGTIVNGQVTVACAGIVISAGGVHESQDVLVEGNTSRYNSAHGIQSDVSNGMTRRITVNDNTLVGNLQHGILVTRAQGWTITNNDIRDNYRGIHVSKANHVRIGYNTIGAEQGTTQGHGIEIWDYPDEPARCVLIHTNLIQGHTNDGINIKANLEDPQRIDTVRISSNSFVNNSKYGIRVEEEDACTIANLALSNNGFVNNGWGETVGATETCTQLASTCNDCPTALPCSSGCEPTGSPLSTVSTRLTECIGAWTEMHTCGNDLIQIATYDCDEQSCCVDTNPCLCLTCTAAEYLECP